jgi:hypothetical protein
MTAVAMPVRSRAGAGEFNLSRYGRGGEPKRAGEGAEPASLQTDRRLLIALIAAFFALSAAQPLPAQTAADTLELAQAVAPVLVDSLVGRVSAGEPIVWLDSRSALNTAVGGILGGHPRLRGPLPDPAHTMWMMINRVTTSGDTARVVVEFGQDYADCGEFTFWTERRAYFFAREAKKTVWRFVGSRFIEHADGGWVRG